MAGNGASFIGAGIAFPMRLDPTGAVALVSDEAGIEESIHLILGTAYGERPMRPEFGCGVHDHVFAPADATTAGLIASEVSRSLRRWEPRIELDDVVVSVDEDTGNRLWIDIRFHVSGVNDPRNLVFPFYVIPEGGE